MTSSLVGSEMCIRDRDWDQHAGEREGMGHAMCPYLVQNRPELPGTAGDGMVPINLPSRRRWPQP
eukprot:4273363-Prorocentrum_lima.AAC.1